MENIKEKAEAVEKVTNTIDKKPWAFLLLVLVIYSYFLYKVGAWSADRQIVNMEAENKRLNEEVSSWKEAYQSLTNNLLIKNNIIYEQREVIKYADSTLATPKHLKR